MEIPAQAQIHLDKTCYRCEEAFKTTLTENLGWEYDLYAAVVMHGSKTKEEN